MLIRRKAIRRFSLIYTHAGCVHCTSAVFSDCWVGYLWARVSFTSLTDIYVAGTLSQALSQVLYVIDLLHPLSSPEAVLLLTLFYIPGHSGSGRVRNFSKVTGRKWQSGHVDETVWRWSLFLISTHDGSCSSLFQCYNVAPTVPSEKETSPMACSAFLPSMILIS